ncbi:uncharacterized protein EV420DRAFT_1567799 [Desarmillaria tabescens]|uniref:F-box domain-containing protein n=1 Tax=Armillaria tabescens TaxID=1929756 RepID=A0AA39MV64_ARMTA|nr:uncharacterized protein EV420DRAFT_1567799 [Desarmillaria tabescens]KAK0447827.1 hypothetical protein EV420DRAFT_1567799 [Desarmillaria tabescens]
MSRLQSFENDYKTALSATRRIPPEITMKILCCSSKDFRFDVFRIREGPWYLGQVCSSWRQVIETLCPELWASIIVRVSFSYMPPKGKLVERLRVVLERSCNHPLDFHFRFCGTEVEESDFEEMERCFDVMIAHSNRWRVADMMITPSLIERLPRIRGKIDWLRVMYLSCGYEPGPGDIHAFEIAPKLEDLYLRGMHGETNIHFPASNLVSLSDARSFGGDRLTPEYLHIVKSSPKLRSISYNDHGFQSPNINSVFHPPVMSPSVEELSASSPSFMRSLVLPSLKNVRLTTAAYDGDLTEETMSCPVDALGALHELLLRSRCSLSRLSLVDVVLDNNLVNIIRLMPALQDFIVQFTEWVDDYDPIMQSLVTQLSETSMVDGSLQHSMVPSLKSIDVYMLRVRYNHLSFIDSTFVDMVASRLRLPSGAPRLMKLNLHISGRGGSSDFDEEAKNALMSLKDEGLQLNYFVCG